MYQIFYQYPLDLLHTGTTYDMVYVIKVDKCIFSIISAAVYIHLDQPSEQKSQTKHHLSEFYIIKTKIPFIKDVG